EIEQHSEALSRCIEFALQGTEEARTFTFVLRSSKSVPALALMQIADRLAAAKINLKAVLARVEPELELHAFFDALIQLSPGCELSDLVRWAKNPRLIDAHEQAVYGPKLCWTGDAIRRDADKLNRLTQFETSTDAVLRGTHAFRALWASSEVLPANLLDARNGGMGDATAAIAKDAPPAALKRPAEGWPLLRH
ncbi:MAG: hypothetical protein AAF405_02360, partial [Pseudomonadota bacterium]